MLLRSADFAALRINWDDKATSLREIARELNIGVDALAFLDDNPAERELIRLELPEVTVVELPADPDGLRPRGWPTARCFERLSLTGEDRERGTSLRRPAPAAPSCARARTSLERLPAVAADRDGHGRRRAGRPPPRRPAHRRRRNQFNLTTRRHSEQEIRALAADPCAHVYDVRRPRPVRRQRRRRGRHSRGEGRRRLGDRHPAAEAAA